MIIVIVKNKFGTFAQVRLMGKVIGTNIISDADAKSMIDDGAIDER